MNKYFYSSIFSLPIVAFINLIFYSTAGLNINTLLAFKTCVLNLVFSIILSLIYNKTKLVGFSIFIILLVLAILGSVNNNLYLVFIYSAFIVFLLLNINSLLKIQKEIDWTLLIILSVANFVLITLFFPVGYISSSLFDTVYSGINIHTDSVYHISIAAMIKGYGVISHGIHGLTALEYHFGSHFILASLSNLLSISAFESYAFIYPFFFIPVFNIAIILLSNDLKPTESNNEFIKRIIFYMACLIMFGIFKNGSLLNNFAVWDSFYVSESYLISLIYLFCLTSVLFNASNLGYKNIFLIFLILLATLITKVSTGIISLIMIYSLILFGKNYSENKIYKLALLIFYGVTVLAFIRFTVNGTEGTYFSPLYFISTYVKSGLNNWIKVPVFLFIHFIFTWTTFLVFLKYRFKSQWVPTWYLISLWLSLIVGIFFVTFYYIQGGSNYYFSNLTMFMSMPMLMIYFGNNIIQNKNKIYLYIIIFILALFYTPRTIRDSFKSYYHTIISVKHHSSMSLYVDELIKLSNNKSNRDALIFIPRSEKLFWQSLNCRTMPFIIPAISGIPAIYAWPKQDCFDWLCGPRFHSNGLCTKVDDLKTDIDLRNEAKRLGFNTVIIITKDGLKTLN
jgi:hypothetical protein